MANVVPPTIEEAADSLRNGETTSAELVDAVLERADRLDPLTGTFVTRFDDYARERAERADRELASGMDRGLLHGIPMGVKDIVAMSEGPTTANSLVLDPAWGAGKDAPVVTRLKGAGAVILGKVTTSEFAIGSPDPAKPFPIPRNPWDLARSPGGSSAGTGNGVAAGLFLAGIGTDTGGSIRIPAAWNGVTGLMPTFGRVPKSGCVPLGYSLDHAGALARSARDCAAVLGVIAGYHPSDESCVDRPVDDYLAGPAADLAGVRIGVDRSPHFFPAEADPSLAGCIDGAVDTLAALGAEIVPVAVPLYHQVNAAVWMMTSAEALAYHHNDLGSRWDDYCPMTRLHIARGALASAADYVQAARVRRVAQHQLARLFGEVDVVLTPTTATAAPTVEEMMGEGMERLVVTLFTAYWDGVGNPVLALPMGFNGEGLPLSLQLAGRPFDEALLCRVGAAYQTATDWHLRPAPVTGADRNAG